MGNGTLPFRETAVALASESGISLPFTSLPPLRRSPRKIDIEFTESGSVFHLALLKVLEAGHLIELDPRSAPPGFWARPFALRRIGKAARFIVDLRELNFFVPDRPFKLPRLRDLGAALAASGSIAVTDIESAFYAVPVDPASARLYRVAVRIGNEPVRSFYHRGLAMGMKSSPRLLQEVMRNAASQADLPPTARTRIYLDDQLLMMKEPPGAAADAIVSQMRNTLISSGLPLSVKKCTWSSRSATVLGFIVDLDTRTFSLPTSKIASTRARFRQLLARSSARSVSGAHRASILGTLSSLAPGLRFSRCATSGLVAQLALQQQVRPEAISLDATGPVRPSWCRRRLALNDAERTDIRHWLDRLDTIASNPAHPGQAQPMLLPPLSSTSIVLACDSSDAGFGYHLVLREVGLPLPLFAAAASTWADISSRCSLPTATAARAALQVAGRWTPQQAARHITFKETLAASIAVAHAASLFHLSRAIRSSS